MPRRARAYIAGMPYHIVQRGNNKEPCFIQPSDYRYYLGLWEECSKLYAVSVHAYCLMTNHIHFVVTPENESGISTTMKVVGSRYAFHINRTGMLWEGRHRSSLIDTDRYLLLCYRYVEMNPVRAGRVRRPEEYELKVTEGFKNRQLLLGRISQENKKKVTPSPFPIKVPQLSVFDNLIKLILDHRIGLSNIDHLYLN